MTKFLHGLNRKHFFTKYATKVGNWQHKLRGLNGSGTERLTFSEEDKAHIKAALDRLFKDLIKRVQ